MSTPVKFRSTMVPPPGGKFFFEHEGERLEARYWLEMEPRVRDLMARHGLKGSPAAIVAEYMCPHMPDWYCEGLNSGAPVIRLHEARDNSEPYFRRPVVTFDEISRRLNICAKCPMHTRRFCLTCTGVLDWVQAGFSGRRPRMLEDKVSGTCICSKALEIVTTAVEYGEKEPVWEGAPKTCWRYNK